MLLIIHYGALGDIICTFPGLIQLRRKFQCIDILSQHKIGKLTCALHLTDQCFPLESAIFSSFYTDAMPSQVQDFLKSYREIIIFSHSRSLKSKISSLTGTEVHFISPRPDVNQSIHIHKYILSHLILKGLIENKEMNELLKTHKKTSLSNQIWIHPGSGSPRKNWDISNFIEIDRLLQVQGMIPEFILGPAEHFLAEPLSKKFQKKCCVIFDLMEVLELFHEGGIFIGNDSGLTHLSAFMGLRTIAIFGPSDPKRWIPLGPAVKVIRPAGLACDPCFETQKSNCDTLECLNRISPQMVIDAMS